jgi:hypothetical protein
VFLVFQDIAQGVADGLFVVDDEDLGHDGSVTAKMGPGIGVATYRP